MWAASSTQILPALWRGQGAVVSAAVREFSYMLHDLEDRQLEMVD